MTFRELLLMAEAKRSDQWDHTAFLLAMMRNCNIDPNKDPPSKVEDFHPFTPEKKERVIAKIKPSMIADAIRRRDDERKRRN